MTNIPLLDICSAQNRVQNLPSQTSPSCSSCRGSPAWGSSQPRPPPPWYSIQDNIWCDIDHDPDDDHYHDDEDEDDDLRRPGLREGWWPIHWLHSLPPLWFWPENKFSIIIIIIVVIIIINKIIIIVIIIVIKINKNIVILPIIIILITYCLYCVCAGFWLTWALL